MREPYRSCPVCEFGYCAPNRCYCAHPECNAYDSYVDIRSKPLVDPTANRAGGR